MLLNDHCYDCYSRLMKLRLFWKKRKKILRVFQVFEVRLLRGNQAILYSIFSTWVKLQIHSFIHFRFPFIVIFGSLLCFVMFLCVFFFFNFKGISFNLQIFTSLCKSRSTRGDLTIFNTREDASSSCNPHFSLSISLSPSPSAFPHSILQPPHSFKIRRIRMWIRMWCLHFTILHLSLSRRTWSLVLPSYSDEYQIIRIIE